MIRIGIIGSGNIAHVLAPVMKSLDSIMTIQAVAARDRDRAESFAKEFSIPSFYGSYDELYRDPEVDLVYIAIPHSHHYEEMKKAIEAGKHVLCEKAFTVNAAEAEEVFALAKEKGVYLAEAIWTRYMPSREMINCIIKSGRIGKVTSISANLGYKILQKPRISDARLAGGALLDIGVYPLNFALMAMEGTPIDCIVGNCVKTEGGVDARNMIQISFAGGSQAVLFSDAECVTDRKGYIYGTEGTIVVENVNNPEKIEVWSADRNPVLLESNEVTHLVNGYEYELISACRCIEAGLLEDPHMPQRETLRIMRYLDALRELWQIKLAGELDG